MLLSKARAGGYGVCMAWDHFTSAKGTQVFFRVDGASLENVIYGHMDISVAVRLQAEFDVVERAHGRFVGFHYWLHAPSYDSDYRALWIKWLGEKKGTLEETHFLTRSRMVRMGLAVANIAYSRIEFVTHTDEATYLAARERHMSFAAIPPRP